MPLLSFEYSCSYIYFLFGSSVQDLTHFLFHLFLCFHNLSRPPHLDKLKSASTTPSVKETCCATTSLLWKKRGPTDLYLFAKHDARILMLCTNLSKHSGKQVFKPLFYFCNFAYDFEFLSLYLGFFLVRIDSQ